MAVIRALLTHSGVSGEQIVGIGISAQIFLTLTNGGNNATVTISPNFNSNTMTLSGSLLPLNQSNIFKGRSW